MKNVDLSIYNNNNFVFGCFLKKAIWYFINIFFFKTSIPFPSIFKAFLLRLFGAKVGKCNVFKPNLNIKYPWNLEIGSFCWVGENVWIDNLALVKIGNNVVLSQGVFLLTGNHNYKLPSFDLILGSIIIENGVWLGAKSLVCPDIICRSHSILVVGSIATSNLDEYSIYQGNPAVYKRARIIT